MSQTGPILIGGLAHSGKTEMRIALSALPHLSLTRRTYMWTRFYKRFGDLARPQNLERCLSAMLAQPSIQAWQLDAERIRREFAAGEASYGRLFALLHTHYARQQGKVRWGEQLGFVERYAEPIFATMPDARMIHMVRDFRTSYAVARQHARHRKGKLGWSMARWLESVRLMEHNRRRCGEQYKVVRYEALMEQPESVLREVCAFLSEDAAPVLAALAQSKLADAPTSESGTISPGETAFVQTYSRSALEMLSYAPARVDLSWRERMAYLVDWPANRTAMAAWRIGTIWSHAEE